MLKTEVVNVTGCVVMNNMGPSVKKKKDYHQNELWYFLSSGDTCCSDPVPMVTMPGLTEILITVAYFSKRWGKRIVAKCRRDCVAIVPRWHDGVWALWELCLFLTVPSFHLHAFIYILYLIYISYFWGTREMTIHGTGNYLSAGLP